MVLLRSSTAFLRVDKVEGSLEYRLQTIGKGYHRLGSVSIGLFADITERT